MSGVHSKLGASSSDRWMNCPGSVTLLERVPADNRSSIYAEEGTAAHGLAERYVKSKWLDPSALPDIDGLLGYNIDVGGAIFPPTHDLENHELLFFPITSEMIAAVKIYEDTIGKILRELGFGDPAKNVQLGLEIQFNLAYIDSEMFGTCDCAIFAPGVALHIVDFKYGAGKVVEVDDNPQLKYYALGAVRHYCWDDAFSEYAALPETVVLHVVQPRAKHKRGPVRKWSIETEELIKTWGLELMSAAKAARKPDAPLAVGDWCRWCAAKAHCNAQKDMVRSKLRVDFRDLELEAVTPRKASAEAKKKAKEHLDNNVPTDLETLAEMVAAVPAIEALCTAIMARAQIELEGGNKVGDYKLVPKNEHRKFNDQREAAEKLKQYGIEESELFETKLKTPAAIEALLPKGDNAKSAADLLKSLLKPPSGEYTVAASWDVRDAVKPKEGAGKTATVVDDEILL